MNFKETKKNIYSKKTNDLKTKIITNSSIFKTLNKDALNQLEYISKLPNIYKQIIGLPDLHIGYGVPIGSCFASTYDDGIISSEAVGFDINCGIRLIKTNLSKRDISKKQELDLVKEFKKLPLGLSNQGLKLNKSEFNEILAKGINWSIDNNFANKKDKQKIDNNGNLKKLKLDSISKDAYKRGINQIGTLGQGNHFIDLVYVKDIFNKQVSKQFGLKQDQYCVLLHSGSRGFGHQIADEYNKKFEFKNPISYQPFHSNLGQEYYNNMLAAANFAFVNRSILSYKTKEAILKALKLNEADFEFDLLYDLCHNIASIEKHDSKKLIVHRKGAIHANTSSNLSKSHVYSKTGTPILLPGSMLHDSYVLTPKNNVDKETFSTVAHGCGRKLSRSKAKEKTTLDKLTKKMNKNNIHICGRSTNLMLEEQPNAYKDSNDVVNSLEDANLVKKVVSLKPRIVVTG